MMHRKLSNEQHTWFMCDYYTAVLFLTFFLNLSFVYIEHVILGVFFRQF